MNGALRPAVRRLPPLPAPGHDQAAAVPGPAAARRHHAQLARRRALRREPALPAARAGRARAHARAAAAERRADPADGRHRQDALPRRARRALLGGARLHRRRRSRAALWISFCKLVWCFIWFWAATSKVNHHFPSVIQVMMNNGPFFPTWLKKRLFADYPDDLRPSRLAVLMARMGTLTEWAIPFVLARANVSSARHGADAVRDGAASTASSRSTTRAACRSSGTS